MKNKLILSLPKGSMENATIELFKKAGVTIYPRQDRAYYLSCDDEELKLILIRAQEIPKYVENGVFDCGITGYDWICETNAKVKEIGELIYSKAGFGPVRWVVAVPEDSRFQSIKDLRGKRVATELVNVTKKFFKRHNINVKVEFSWGATESKPAAGLVDAVVELTETGTSLRANKLRIIAEVLHSTMRFISNISSYKDKWKREKMENLYILLKGAINATSMVGLKMNVEKKNLQKILNILPALKNPTISPLSVSNWVAVEVIIEEKIVKTLLPQLKRSGAQGIIEYPLNKLIY